MRIAIMQPYFFPYLGYFQLINSVDKFVVYDNIEYTKKGWINRNRILKNNKDELITLPLKKDSDYLTIDKRFLSDNWNTDRKKLLNVIKDSYKKAPFFVEIYPLFENCLIFTNTNLFDFILNTIKTVCSYLEINTQIIISSELNYNNDLRSTKKVIEICKTLNANTYINPIGGKELYNKNEFKGEGIELHFIETKFSKYKQFGNEFIQGLSIIDVLMFNSKNDIKEMLNQYILV